MQLLLRAAAEARAREDMQTLGADVRLPEGSPGLLWRIASTGPVLLPRWPAHREIASETLDAGPSPS